MGRMITIIGGGNLGASIAEGLLKSKFCKPAELTVTKRNISTLKALEQKGVQITTDNSKAVKNGEVIILAIKPFQTTAVLQEIKKDFNDKKLLISVVTGVSISEIAIQESMTCISHQQAAGNDVEYVSALFAKLGKVVTIDEKLMDASTILGACGTAYALRYIRACIQGGIEIGFDAATASLIAAQTTKGAAELLLLKGSHPEQEIDKVTTPKGCTIAGLNEMEHQGFSSSLIKGIVASYKKIAKD